MIVAYGYTIIAIGRTIPTQLGRCHSDIGGTEIGGSGAADIVDADVVDRGGGGYEGFGTGSLVEPEESQALNSLHRVEIDTDSGPVSETNHGERSHIIDHAPRRGEVGIGGDHRYGRVDQEYHKGIVGVAGGATRTGAEGEVERGVDGSKVDVAIGGDIDNG